MVSRGDGGNPRGDGVSESESRSQAPVPGLPTFAGAVLGRSGEVAELARVLGSSRLVTLTGPAGIGKTRLAVEVTGRTAPGRAWFVDLAPLREERLVPERVAAAFGLGELRGRDLAGLLDPALPAAGLLVLDNCEHVAGACAALARELLAGSAGGRILATSQQRLGLPGEVEWVVPPLELPAPGTDVEPEDARRAPAVQLFIERAAAARPNFVPASGDVEAIVEICRRLDANPFAIELAAARVRTLAPAEIAARLERRFQLLRSRPGATEGRYQSLAAALSWSHDLLSGPEKALLRRMSVFPGSFGFPAVEEVCRGGEVGPDDVLDLLSGVIAKSLVAGNTTGRAARYRLAETVRLYAALCLRAAGEAADVGERHARWCMRIVEDAAEGGPGAPTLGELDAEVDNVHAALEWCVTHDRADLGLRLATAYVVVWRAAGRMAEAREWLLRVLAMGEGEPAALRARALYDAGFAALLLGDFDAARSHVEASLAASAEAADPPSLVQRTKGLLAMVSTLSEGRGGVDELERRVEEARARDDPHLAEALVGCGHARLFRGEPVAALAHFDELVAVSRRRGNLATLATGLVGAGTAALGQGDCRRAGDRLREGIAVATATADVHTEVIGRISLAELARLTADLEGARGQLEECLARAGPMGAPYPVALARLGLARTVLEQGHAEAARRHFQEALAVAGRARLGHVEAAALEGLGEAVLALGDGRTADELFERALAVARECAERTATARATSALAERGRARGDRARASAGHHDALRVFHQVGARPGVVDSLEALGGLALDGDSLARAARLFGAAAAMRDAGGWARRARAQDRHPADLARLQERMGRQELEEAWAAGAALGGDQAVAYASRGRGQRTGATRGPESLTRAEREVVALAVERLTTDEIAGRLFISPRTVHSHLRRVYAKLGVTSRRELRERTVGDRTPG